MDWPASLPLPLAPGYGVAPQPACARTDMESGPARVRRRFTATPDHVAVAWKFTLTEMAAFRDFYKNGIAGGAAWFNITLLDGFSGAMVMRAARFIGEFEAQLENRTVWRVTGRLELRSA